MWWPLIGPHVAIPFIADKPCHLPTVKIATCHVSYGLPRQHPYGMYGLYSQHPFFCMFVILNRMQYLSLPTSVWTQMTCVGFITMMPMLLFDLKWFRALWNFEQNLIPWSHLPIGKILDLQKTIFSLSEDEGIAPSPFQPQSTWLFLDLYL